MVLRLKMHEDKVSSTALVSGAYAHRAVPLERDLLFGMQQIAQELPLLQRSVIDHSPFAVF